MNASQIINMVLRMAMRRVIGRGVNAGIDRAFGTKKASADMSPEDRAKARAAGQNAARSKRAIRNIRRFGRF